MQIKQNVNSEAEYEEFKKEIWDTLPRDEDGKLNEEWIKQEMWDYFCTMYNYSYVAGAITDKIVVDTRENPDKIIGASIEAMNNYVTDRARDMITVIMQEI